MEYAPILLFAYKRLEHLGKVIDSLQGNRLAKQSLLYIYSDGPRDASDYETVENVRIFCRNIEGFKNVIVVERCENLGLAQSIITGVSEILSSHDKVIVLEDDLVVSKYFLDFMNSGLKEFENDDRVCSINGYMYPTARQMEKPFFLRHSNCWGWATWARAWKDVEWNAALLNQNLTAQGLSDAFDFGGTFPFSRVLARFLEGKMNSWAIRWQASNFLADKLSLYPPKSLVYNCGFDSSGEHCLTTNAYDVILNDECILVKKEDVPGNINQQAYGFLVDYFRRIAQSR